MADPSRRCAPGCERHALFASVHMGYLQQIKLGQRLGLGFGLVLFLSAVIAGVGWFRLSLTISDVKDNELVQARATSALKWEGLTLLNVNRTLAIAESGGLSDVKAHFSPLIKETSTQISAIQKGLEASSTTPEERGQFADIAAKRKVYITSRDAIFTLLELDDPGAKEALKSQLLPAATRYITAINAYQLAQRKMADARLAETEVHVNQAKGLLLILTLVCLAIGAACGWFITRSVTQPLDELVSHTKVIASGDLSQHVAVLGRDELADLGHSLEDMQVSLRDIVGDVRRTTDSIATASDQVAVGSQDLSSRTEQAASSLQETASTMEQISGTIRHTADAAQSANQLAAGAAQAATEGWRRGVPGHVNDG